MLFRSYVPDNTLGKRISDINNSFESLKEDKETSLFIKKLLIRLKLAPDNVEISYLFRFAYQNFTYFFYVKDNSSVEILRHDMTRAHYRHRLYVFPLKAVAARRSRPYHARRKRPKVFHFSARCNDKP